MSVLSLKSITIDFPGVRALEDVNLDVRSGEIHGLVGENGAGKSTLIKIIAGVWTYGSYEGSMSIDNGELRFHSVRDSEQCAIRIIHQEMSLVNEMSAAENIFLGDEPRRWGVIDYGRMRARARETLARLGCAHLADRTVVSLSIGEQQMVEIAKALSQKARFILFDEPTAALPEKDVENLMRLIRELRAQGLGIIYVSHKLNEVCELSDRVTVLRNGRLVTCYERKDLSVGRLAADMIGRSLDAVFPEMGTPRDEEVLSMERVSAFHPVVRDKAIIRDLTLSCKAGEVLGIAGLMGSGRTALMSLLFGVFDGPWSGALRFRGKGYKPQSPSDALRRGMVLVSEDRKRYGVVGTRDVEENLVLSSLRQFRRGGLLDPARLSTESRKYVSRLNIKTPSLEFPVLNLSGGNQQKVVLGRFLMTSPTMLLLDDPTRGVDVGAKAEIYRLIHELAGQGMAILFASSELPEVLGVCHRVVVLHNGVVRSEFGHGEKSEEETLTLAAGG